MGGGTDRRIATSAPGPAAPKTLSILHHPPPRSWDTQTHTDTHTRVRSHTHQQQQLLGFTAGPRHGEGAVVGGRVGPQKPDPGGVPVPVCFQRVLQGWERRGCCTHMCLQHIPCTRTSLVHTMCMSPCANMCVCALPKCVLTPPRSHPCPSAGDPPMPHPRALTNVLLVGGVPGALVVGEADGHRDAGGAKGL